MSQSKDITALDANDPLAHCRDEFLLPENTVYLDGNSLGALSKRSQQRVNEVVQNQWGEDLIKSWNSHRWIDLPSRVGEKIAPLIGAAKGQTVCCDSISVNLFKLLSYALQLKPNRKIILSQIDNFPTDLYMAQGLQSLLGDQRCELVQVAAERIYESLTEEVAILMLTHVNFRNGEMHDMQALTEQAHKLGILVIWDLAHSAGAVPLELDACNVDFAVGCGYKYLNGGPGAPAFIYVAERHQNVAKQPLSGWMGHRKPFEFISDYQPGNGMQQFLTGTPSILSMAALDAALDIFANVSIKQIYAKSMALTELFCQLVEENPELQSLTNLSPTSVTRGSQIALSHPHAFAISQALIADNIVVDYRAPNIIRFGFAPLYTRFQDVAKTVEVLAEIMCSQRFHDPIYKQRATVT